MPYTPHVDPNYFVGDNSPANTILREPISVATVSSGGEFDVQCNIEDRIAMEVALRVDGPLRAQASEGSK